VQTIVTETVTQPATPAPSAAPAATSSGVTPHGGHAVARAQ
jgi:hypothetical protein